MRIVKTAITVALAAVGLIAGGATALAAPAVGTSPVVLRTVTAWHDVNVRLCSSSSCQRVGSVKAGESRLAACWVYGETITDSGVTNDVWLQVGREDGGTQWASAVYFVGDKFGNLPAHAQCDI